MAAPQSDRDRSLDYWRGKMDARMDDIEDAMERSEASHLRMQMEIKTALDKIRIDINESNIKQAGYIKGIAVIAALFFLIAPYLLRLVFGK